MTIGSLMALEAIKVIVKAPSAPPLTARFLAIDLATHHTRAMAFTRRSACRACGDAPSIDVTNASDYERDECD
jgi:molybdopterin/thiamine biosynthesis adenylyltransferase